MTRVCHQRIRRARKHELPQLTSLIRACTQELLQHGIDQWDASYPNPHIIQQDLEKEEAWVLETQEEIVGMIVLNEEEAIEYQEVEWLNCEGKVLIPHRLAIHPAYQGKGYATVLMSFVEQYGQQHGYQSIRLDTYSGNPITPRFYEKCGYQRVGRVHFDDKRKPFWCYEKMLTTSVP